MTMNQNVYLKPNMVIEPLFDRWYAWTHLISPATCARNITGRHLKIINSYIQAPHIHAAAVKNPKMLGGPFMDYSRDRQKDIEKLRDETLQNQEMMIKLSKAIEDLDKLLKTKAKGYSLEELYDEVPDMLKGYVELFYDLNDNPGYRFFEALLYDSEFYNKSSQSIALWMTNNDARPFCLSTPKLNDESVIHLNIPFDHKGIDMLSRMKRKPASVDEIARVFGIDESQRKLFDTFFSNEAPPKYKEYKGEHIRMRYFGHACILIETKDISILIDPLISYYGYPSAVEHFTDVDLPDIIDYVFITHNHQDHILFETLLPLRHKIRNVIVPRSRSGNLQDPNVKLTLEHIGFNNVREIDEMEEISFHDCVVTGIPFTGEHCDLNVRAKICYHVMISGFSLLFVSDSRVVEPRLYQHVHKKLGDIDVIFLGMECDGAPLTWLYGPLLTKEMPRDKDGSRRLSGSDCKKGMGLVDVFNPKEVYVYAMGQEPWVEFISSVKYTDESNPIVQSNLLIKECESRGIIAERLYGEKEILYSKLYKAEPVIA